MKSTKNKNKKNKRKGGKKTRNGRDLRINPIEVVEEFSEAEITYLQSPRINFTHTRNRYSWICSLRSTGTQPEHLCAVTILSVPPQPTVIVSAAHCTYLCKDPRGFQVDSCCCSEAGLDCSEDRVRCGDKPEVHEMTGADADILCGEWQTGPFLSEDSGEDNIKLDITKIVRHPDFVTNAARKDGGGGPRLGKDIAVFMVNDTQLQDDYARNKTMIRPACLPESKQKRTGAGAVPVHAGWARPPALSLGMFQSCLYRVYMS